MDVSIYVEVFPYYISICSIFFAMVGYMFNQSICGGCWAFRESMLPTLGVWVHTGRESNNIQNNSKDSIEFPAFQKDSAFSHGFQ
jgi:hypothetical protein